MATMTKNLKFATAPKEEVLSAFLPAQLKDIGTDQSAIPKLAKDGRLTKIIDDTLPTLPTFHRFHLADATAPFPVKKESVHLVLTSPPYWNLKRYNDCGRQLGNMDDYEEFLIEIEKVWQSCYDALVPGGRLICVVGDVCLSQEEEQREAHGRPAARVHTGAVQENRLR